MCSALLVWPLVQSQRLLAVGRVLQGQMPWRFLAEINVAGMPAEKKVINSTTYGIVSP